MEGCEVGRAVYRPGLIWGPLDGGGWRLFEEGEAGGCGGGEGEGERSTVTHQQQEWNVCMVSKNNVLYTGVQFRQKVRERFWVKHWTTSSAFSQKMTTSWKVMNLSLFWQQNPYLHEEKKLFVGYRFLVNEYLCQASYLGKSGGFGTCRTNSLVIITPTSRSSISTGNWSVG